MGRGGGGGGRAGGGGRDVAAPTPGVSTGSQIARAFSDVGARNAIKTEVRQQVFGGIRGSSLVTGDRREGYNYQLQNGVLTIQGTGNNTSSVRIGGNATAQGFIDRNTSQLFGVIGRDRVEINVRDNNLVITEVGARTRSTTRIPIVAPVSPGQTTPIQ